jgi:hypothetical protein
MAGGAALAAADGVAVASAGAALSACGADVAANVSACCVGTGSAEVGAIVAAGCIATRVGGNAAGAAICGAAVGSVVLRANKSMPRTTANKNVARAVAPRSKGKAQEAARDGLAIERGKANERGAWTRGISRTAATVTRSVARSRAQSAHDVRCRSTSARSALLTRPSRYGESSSCTRSCSLICPHNPAISHRLALTV